MARPLVAAVLALSVGCGGAAPTDLLGPGGDAGGGGSTGDGPSSTSDAQAVVDTGSGHDAASPPDAGLAMDATTVVDTGTPDVDSGNPNTSDCAQACAGVG